MIAKIKRTLLSKAPQVFVMCCDMRNFTAVAKALGLTQSAVSKIISNFEDELGFTLFVRNSRPLALTSEARLLDQYLRKVSGDFSHVVTQIQNHNSIKPVLRVGILESLSLSLGVEIIRRTLPVLSQITLLTASANVLKQRLLERKLDLIITNDVSMDIGRVFATHLFDEPSILMLPKRLTQNRDIAWDWKRLQCCGLPMISYWNVKRTVD